MIHILHISDLHLVVDPQWNNMKNAILSSVRKRLEGVPKGEKLLVITGDLHNFIQNDYNQAENFLLQLFKVMGIEPEKDVFIVPGNHDLSNGDPVRKIYTQAIRTDSKLLQGNVDRLLSYYCDYLQFVKKIGVYHSDCGNFPVCAHVRTWRNKLKILHLNTTLVADGKHKDGQLTDIYTATSDGIRRELSLGNLPCIAIGHNSFFDLKEDQQTVLSAMFLQENISAYLCGDRHKRFSTRRENKIALSSGYGSVEIPNIVSYRTSTDENDTYSDFGMIWHNWDEESGRVTLEFMKWNPEDQADLQPDGAKDNFCFRQDMQKPVDNSYIEKEDNFKTDNNLDKNNDLSRDTVTKKKRIIESTKGILGRVRRYRLQLSVLLIFVCLFGIGAWYYTSGMQDGRFRQKGKVGQKEAEKKSIEEDYTLRKNEDGLWELDLSELNLSNIDFLGQYNLSKIQELKLSDNSLLSDINVLKNMKNLKRLDLSNTSVADASAVKELSKLEMLYLDQTEVSNIEYIKSLHELTSLDVSSCEKLENIAIVSELPNLRTLDISDCENDKIWRSLPVLPQLETLLMNGYNFKGQFDFGLYPSLTTLYLWGCDVENLSTLLPLHKLKKLNVIDTVIDFAGIEKFSNLEYLRMGMFLSENAKDRILQNLEGICNLKLNSLHYFTRRKEIPNVIAHISNLEELTINAQEMNLEDASFLANKKNLKSLDLTCKISGDISVIGKLNQLKELFIFDENYLSENPQQKLDLSFLKHCNKLEKLELYYILANDISFLSSCTFLKELSLRIGGIKDFSAMEELTELKKLEMREISNVKDFTFLKRLQQLEELTIGDAGLADFYGISRLTSLRKLSMPYTTILNADFLNNLVNLEYLDLPGDGSSEKEEFNDISFVKEMKKLKALNLPCRKIEELSPLKNLKQLLTLDLSGTDTDTDILILSEIGNLNSLSLQSRKIKNLAPLASMRYLGSLNLEECFFGTKANWDFKGFANLRELNVRSSTISSLDWLDKDNKICSINVTDTMMDDLYSQLKFIINGKGNCTVTYDVSALTSTQLKDLKKINPSCEWEAEDY